MKVTDINGYALLHNGIKMPYIGLGVYKTKDGKEVQDAVTYALDAGYRHIDTAAAYFNETGVGQAIRRSNTPREDIFLTSKIWNSDQGYDSTIRAFNHSLQRLGTSYLDLYLQHWPVKGKYKETWKAMETLYNEGRIKAIGVCNFLQFQLEDLMETATIVPMVNQVEFHPFLVQQSLLDFCNRHDIQFESWFPLMHGFAFQVPAFREMALRYNVTVAQLLLRWNLQKGVVIIPKSIRRDRIISNSHLFHFNILPTDMQKLDDMDEGLRMGPNPADFNF
ncbi:aldo/keto reductase [Chitinophaga filiformis]|uniref:aldo/keto reductase n=1 Tax=Chitinophaga filiformis TaxID=104663 RepID=UPI001F46D2D4|nr:aldo/keto reductase [Chitinophaga filiformis]MCF6406414.1 aldo/keto reductase [Chitinophaga filiformis]